MAGTLAPFVISPNASLEELHRVCSTMAAHFREGHRELLEANKDSDKSMVWLGGLMGAGLFASQGLLAPAPLSIRVVTLVPWTLGILTAMLARLLYSEYRNLLDEDYFGRVAVLDFLQLEMDRARILKSLPPLITWATQSDPQHPRLLTAVNAAYYLTYILLAVGAVAAATTTIAWGK
jgi:hypothetical protein